MLVSLDAFRLATMYVLAIAIDLLSMGWPWDGYQLAVGWLLAGYQLSTGYLSACYRHAIS